MQSNIKCDYMTREDLEYLCNHLTQFDEFWNSNLLKSEFESDMTTCIVAKKIDDSNEIVGFASLWEPPYEIHVNNIVVKKSMRNKKIGSILLEKLIEISKEKNNKELTLEVNIKNIPAIKLYKKYNFEKIGVRKKYYNNEDDALIMTKNLSKN